MTTWVKVYNSMPSNPKMLQAGDRASWLFVCGLCYANEHLTDGFIASYLLPAVAPGVDGASVLAAELVAAGLWHAIDGGWQINDYGEHQRSADEIRDRRAADAQRKADARDANKRVSKGRPRGQAADSPQDSAPDSATDSARKSAADSAERPAGVQPLDVDVDVDVDVERDSRAKALSLKGANAPPADFPEHLRPHLTAAHRVLNDLAVRHNAKAVTVAALARTIMARPHKPLIKAALDFVGWADGPDRRQHKDVIAGYRNWLDRESDLAGYERLDENGLPSNHRTGTVVPLSRPNDAIARRNAWKDSYPDRETS